MQSQKGAQDLAARTGAWAAREFGGWGGVLGSDHDRGQTFVLLDSHEAPLQGREARTYSITCSGEVHCLVGTAYFLIVSTLICLRVASWFKVIFLCP